jgi:hypothetical protein
MSLKRGTAMKIIKLSKVQFVLYFVSLMLFLSNYGYAAHWPDPENSINSLHLIGLEFTINGSDAEIGDEVAVFDSGRQLVGHFTVHTPGEYGDMPIWIDSDITQDIDEGCSIGSDLSICIWDESAAMEDCDNDVELVIPEDCVSGYCPPDSLPLTCTSGEYYLLNIHHANDPPFIPQLISPADGQTDLGTTVEFEWNDAIDPNGDEVTYELHVCEDINFTKGCIITEIASLNEDNIFFAGSGIGLLLFGIVFADGVRNKKRKVVLLIAMIIIAVYSASCGSGGGDPPPADPPPAEKVTATGTVHGKDGNAIEGAEVTISSDPVTVITDKNGYFSVEVEVGNHEIVIKKGSEEIYSGTFSCDGGATCALGNINTIVVSQEVIGIKIGTKYYWKIIASDGKGGITASEVRSFTT